MRIVTRRTGLTADLVRVWERRYGAVTPARTSTRRRLFSESEIARLQMLREATRAGYGIGQIARLSERELCALLRREPPLPEPNGSAAATGGPCVRDHVGEGLAAIRALDAQGLETVLQEAASVRGRWAVLEQVLAPLMQQVGSLWRSGSFRIAQEHVATAVIRAFLAGFPRDASLAEGAPRVLVTTPAGHQHELGAILVSVAARSQGWHVTYLGPSLPAEEIAAAALDSRARVVALSLVYPEGDPGLGSELTRLRQFLPPGTAILAGGRAARSYRSFLEQIHAIELSDLAALRSTLNQLRGQP
jgi:MerR family transcriptional regulator, light-induced transcriptional regulator